MGDEAFWGPVTSSADCCEQNYVVSCYAAEFYNSISNAPGIILAFGGLIYSIWQGFEKRFSVLHLSTLALGIGSVFFHMTLKHTQQQSSETPMVWVMLLYIYVLYSPDWHYKSTMPTFLFIYGTAFAVLHSQFQFVTVFQVHYLFLACLCLPRMYKYYIHMTDMSARGLVHVYIATMVAGCTCWLLDWAFCEAWAVNLQGHAWWHLFMGFNAYFFNTFLQFCRACQRHWSPQLRYTPFLLPYVEISKPKTP